MRLRHIEVFHAIRRGGSISRAAELLNVSQPAVSKALKHAELQIGFKLFTLVRGRLHPTHEAEMLGPAVDKLFLSLDAVRELAANARLGASGRLRIACLPMLGLSLLPRAVTSYRRRYANATLDIGTRVLPELYRALLLGEFDLGVGIAPESEIDAPPGLAVETLGLADYLYIERAAPRPRKSDAPAIRLKDIDLDKLIGLSVEPSGSLLRGAFERQGLRFAPKIEVQTHYIAKSLVIGGAGCAIVDEFTARSEPVAGMAIRPLSPALRLRVNVYLSSFQPASKPVERFVLELRTAYAQVMAELHAGVPSVTS
jgi:DNA-binding transcriptional LysR family regulator